jgi:hypothetical protein
MRLPEILEIMIIEIGLADDNLDHLASGIDADLDGASATMALNSSAAFFFCIRITAISASVPRRQAAGQLLIYRLSKASEFAGAPRHRTEFGTCLFAT